MGYTGYKKFSPLTDSIGLIVDGCGETYEDKYYVNGTYVDLCGLSTEEYMKNPCCCGNYEPITPSKPVNKITVKSYKNENGEIYYQAYASIAVTSNVVITVPSINGIVTVLEIYVGETKSAPEKGETLEFSGVTINLEEDDDYKYVVGDSTNTTYDIYVATLHVNDLVNLDATDILKFEMTTMELNTAMSLKYIIPATSTNYNMFDDISKFEEFCKENQYCFSLVLPSVIYDKKQYSILNYGGSDVTTNFQQEGGIFNVNGEDVVCLVEKAKTDITPFVPLYNEEISYEYKLTLNN